MLISNIQRFSLHDGPGIRTTVFVKGCSIHCPWCANPEDISSNVQLYFNQKKCVRNNGQCIFNNECPMLLEKYSSIDLKDAYNCPINAVAAYGTSYTSNNLVNELLKDQAFYGKDGGVTFSGGEALLYINELAPVINKLKSQGIHTCVESCLFVPRENVVLASELVNLFIIDVKLLDKTACKKILGGDLDLYMQNLDFIFHTGKTVILRIPIVPGITDTALNLHLLHCLLSKYSPNKVQIFSVHNLAESKYQSLGLEYQKFSTVTLEGLNIIRNYLSDVCTNIEICSL